MKLSAGDIVLARFPFTDLSGEKRRPALVLSVNNDGEDIIVCAITSRPYHGRYDIPIEPNDQNGLKVPSWVQFDKIATLAKTVISGRMGVVSEPFMQKNRGALRTLLGI